MFFHKLLMPNVVVMMQESLAIKVISRQKNCSEELWLLIDGVRSEESGYQ